NECLSHMNMLPSDVAGKPSPEGMYALALGLVGTEAAIAFCAFVKDYEVQITAEDVLDGKLTKSEIEIKLRSRTFSRFSFFFVTKINHSSQY
ncbi:MAG: hypothetical protein VX566_04765, partial [Candidatus Thermoplasmatota archaeon]|nr:hypothetical protein [Candidatus Thermoplasmatota archaeon]